MISTKYNSYLYYQGRVTSGKLLKTQTQKSYHCTCPLLWLTLTTGILFLREYVNSCEPRSNQRTSLAFKSGDFLLARDIRENITHAFTNKIQYIHNFLPRCLASILGVQGSNPGQSVIRFFRL